MLILPKTLSACQVPSRCVAPFPQRMVNTALVTRSRLVRPHDPEATITFFAAEVLRIVSGSVFDELGKRFAKKLGRRECVTRDMRKNRFPHSTSLFTRLSLTIWSGAASTTQERRKIGTQTPPKVEHELATGRMARSTNLNFQYWERRRGVRSGSRVQLQSVEAYTSRASSVQV